MSDRSGSSRRWRSDPVQRKTVTTVASRCGGNVQPARRRRRNMRTMRSRVPRKLLWVVGAILLTLLLGGCGKDLPQNTFNPAGPRAQSAAAVLILPLIIAGIGCVGVEGGIVFLAIKMRHRRVKEQL